MLSWTPPRQLQLAVTWSIRACLSDIQHAFIPYYIVNHLKILQLYCCAIVARYRIDDASMWEKDSTKVCEEVFRELASRIGKTKYKVRADCLQRCCAHLPIDERSVVWHLSLAHIACSGRIICIQPLCVSDLRLV